MKRTAMLSTLLALAIATSAPVAAAGKTYTVTFAGKGVYSASGTQSEAPLCSQAITSNVQTNFSWSVTWKHVSPAGGSLVVPNGRTTGTAHQTASLLSDASRCTYKPCDKTLGLFADNGPNASQPARIKVNTGAPGKVQFTVEILETPTADGVQCHAVAAYEPFYATGRGLLAGGDTLGAIQGTAVVPLAQLRANGKIILIVHSTPLNYPTKSDCMGTPIEGMTCTHSQHWDGTITITRE